MKKLGGWAWIAAWIATVIAGCGGSGSGAGGGGGGGAGGAGAACGEEPTQCPAGETCWIDAAGEAFECQPSGAGKEGDPCAPTKGAPTCTDGFFCFKPKGADGGVCTKLCDAGTNPCGANQLCALMEVAGGAQTHICQ